VSGPENFAGRDFILATTFAVILVTVLVQGSTLGLEHELDLEEMSAGRQLGEP
jgi:NhaP-type Na+/H+ or K+/H+ antiporter